MNRFLLLSLFFPFRWNTNTEMAKRMKEIVTCTGRVTVVSHRTNTLDNSFNYLFGRTEISKYRRIACHYINNKFSLIRLVDGRERKFDQLKIGKELANSNGNVIVFVSSDAMIDR